jgi:hypothetical protein
MCTSSPAAAERPVNIHDCEALCRQGTIGIERAGHRLAIRLCSRERVDKTFAVLHEHDTGRVSGGLRAPFLGGELAICRGIRVQGRSRLLQRLQYCLLAVAPGFFLASVLYGYLALKSGTRLFAN